MIFYIKMQPYFFLERKTSSKKYCKAVLSQTLQKTQDYDSGIKRGSRKDESQVIRTEGIDKIIDETMVTWR